MIDPVSMQYPVYSSSGQVQALYYQSGYDVNQNRHPEYVQIPSRRWPMTPQSHVGTPERTHHPSPSENTWPSPILSGENAESKRRTIDKNVNSVSRRAHLESLERSPSHETESITSSESSQEMFYYGSVSPSAFTTEIGSSRREKSATRGQAQAELDPELRCPLCDKVFTRRSNCREHLKRHNPVNRQAHPCRSCGKTFGRKTDLKRHYMTRIHDGEKRFTCDLCGRQYSRLDTMHRHQKDGCPERKPRSKTGKHGSLVHAVQYAQQFPS
ncbi:C2H2 finger domain protein (Ezf), putative [Talaromyces marneffei ATCC 18224]|nr:C2H2 finger domain protein (Ezf), putative [Talaromyces marneffei ATCC 18224]